MLFNGSNVKFGEKPKSIQRNLFNVDYSLVTEPAPPPGNAILRLDGGNFLRLDGGNFLRLDED